MSGKMLMRLTQQHNSHLPRSKNHAQTNQYASAFHAFDFVLINISTLFERNGSRSAVRKTNFHFITTIEKTARKMQKTEEKLSSELREKEIEAIKVKIKINESRSKNFYLFFGED